MTCHRCDFKKPLELIDIQTKEADFYLKLRSILTERNGEQMAAKEHWFGMAKIIQLTASSSKRASAPSSPLVNRKLISLPFIKDLLLILRPVATWNRIALEPHSVPFIFFVNFLPLLLLSAAAEGIGLFIRGQQRLGVNAINQVTVDKIVKCEALGMGLMLGSIILAAALIKLFGNACHRRNFLAQSLTLLLHALGPFLLVDD